MHDIIKIKLLITNRQDEVSIDDSRGILIDTLVSLSIDYSIGISIEER